ncbi:MAG: YbjN domain-containing protein [Anaerolineae bacterium]|nr:YbjN domain-containing protein [Anaerolineae bacterium]
MQFKTRAQEATYKKTEQMLRQLFGEMVHMVQEAPAFVIPSGTALTHIIVSPWGEKEATITVRAYVTFGSDLTQDLLHFLLRQNDTMRFGAFGIDADGDIFFEHTIVGSTCDKEELRASVMAVAQTADLYDEQIMQKWGGTRAIDRAK